MGQEHAFNLLTFPHNGEARPAARADEPVRDPCSPPIQRQLERIAPSDVTVLIIGETGTGKELVARQIHERSRPRGPFVAVNCGAFSESLVDAEFFGHEAGAFTGAQQARAGWFEAAHGGTLFLDEIGDMPMHLQVKLLRVLQEKQVVRIGSRKPIGVDVRVIAATNVELEAAVQAGQFRRDLYYRLNVAALRLPPLRERPADILPLARHFLETYARKLGMRGAALSASAARALQGHPWPGNVRELENAVQVGLLMCRNGVLDVGDLPVGRAVGADLPEGGGADEATHWLQQGLRRLLESGHGAVYDKVERLLVTTAFEHCSGNQVHTARCLGVSRNVVRAQLKRFGLLGCESASEMEQEDAVALA